MNKPNAAGPEGPVEPLVGRLCKLISDDAYAMQFQTIGQYRTALLAHAVAAIDSAGNTFISRNGAGTQKAELLEVTDGIATLRMLTGKRRQTWQLKESFLRSPYCGWKPLTPNNQFLATGLRPAPELGHRRQTLVT